MKAPQDGSYEDKGGHVLPKQLYSAFDWGFQASDYIFSGLWSLLTWVQPQCASLRPILVLAPEDGDVEINPEKEVDDGYGDEGPCSPRDCSSPFQLYPYDYEQHKTDALKFWLKLVNYS